MPKRHSDPQENRPQKRARVSAPSDAAQAATDGPGTSQSASELFDKTALTTISPALLSGDGMSAAKGIRRRMNPESLAVRLGPDLVKELESLLVPGMTEMPPFSVRQEIQQRYTIDRRHIYDWFHNKGLRVASTEQREERRAARVRLNSDKRNLRNCRPVDIGLSSCPGQSCDPELTESTSTPPSSPDLPVLPLPANAVPCEAVCQQATAMLPALSDYTDCPSFASPCVSGLPPPSLLANSRSFDPAALGPLSPGPIHATSETLNQVPAERTSIWIAEQQKIACGEPAYEPSNLFGMENALQDCLHAYDTPPADNEPVLPQPLREAFYQSLVNVLPPACGIEESVGTYKAFMTQQVQTYYDMLTCSGRKPSSGSATASAGVVPQATALPPLSSATSVENNVSYQSPLLPGVAVTPTEMQSEFSSWLLYGGRSHPANDVLSPSCTPALSESATTVAGSTYWLPEPFLSHVRERSSASCLQINELLESPVLRSRNPTCCVLTDLKPQMDTLKVPHVEDTQIVKPEISPSFIENAFPVAIEGPMQPSASVGFVHEYVRGGLVKASAVHHTDCAVSTNQNPTIFIAESGGENVPTGSARGGTRGGAGKAPPKGKGRGKPRGRPPAQKTMRAK